MLRSHRLLRLSVTDRCNFRCRYCMPAEGVAKLHHSELLSLEALAETVGWLCGHLGMECIKLTGGEPLIRSGIEILIARLSAIPHIREVSLITNGALLQQQAAVLKAAGLARITVSLDSMDASRYHDLTRGGRLQSTLNGIDAARVAGLTPIKLNAVLQRSTWRTEVPLLLDYAAANGFAVRFIELMRTGTERTWCEAEYVSAREVRQWLAGQTTVCPVVAESSGPARLTRVDWNGGNVAVGWITPRSQPFCDHCDRLRMDARGRVHRCLMDRSFFELASMRGQSGDESVEAALRAYLAGKVPPGRMEKPDAMILIGG